MRKEKALISMLRGLVSLIAEESARNPEFSARLENLLPKQKDFKDSTKGPLQPKPVVGLPDIYDEWSARGESNFRIWLRAQPILVLRALIRKHDIDPTRRSTKWKEIGKLADFIADSLRSRLSRGSSFFGKKMPEQDQKN